MIDGEAARSVVEVEDDAAAFFGDDAHGLVEDFAAMTVGGENIAGGAAGVDADENGMRAGGTRFGLGCCGGSGVHVGAEVAADERDVALAALDLAFVGDHAEFAVAGLDAGLAGAEDVALIAEAVADELGDGENAEAVLLAEGDEVGDAGHFAVVAHDFADDAGGGEAGEAGEVD